MVAGKFCVETEKQTRLSGSYIRSLVKQFTQSRRTKDFSKSGEDLDGDRDSEEASFGGGPEIFQPMKKVRRRTRARRPYQDSLVNTAEARREIVKALKLHREKQVRPEVQTPEPESDSHVSASSSGHHLFPLGLYSSSSSPTAPLAAIPRTPSLSSGSSGVDFPGLRPEAEELFSFPFDEAMEFPDWLDANNDTCLQHLNDCSHLGCLQDHDLPWMDIEEIEGMDGDWLA